MGTRTIAGWLQGRWSDELAKNAQDHQAGDVITLGAVSIVAELSLMSYTRQQVLKATRRVRPPELQWVAQAARLWLQRLPNDQPSPALIQTAFRRLERALLVQMC